MRTPVIKDNAGNPWPYEQYHAWYLSQADEDRVRIRVLGLFFIVAVLLVFGAGLFLK